MQQFETLTGVFIDHIVVVNFAGFEDMVNAIGGVPVCIPEDIVDPAHGINIPAGTREIEGREALNYVRARYTLGDGSDIGRIKRQQAFIAAMAEKVISAGTLARVDRLVRFLNAATQVADRRRGTRERHRHREDRRRASRASASATSSSSPPRTSTTRATPSFAGRVYLKDSASRMWEQIAADEPLDKEFTSGRSAPGGCQGRATSRPASRSRRPHGPSRRAVRVTEPRTSESPAERRARLDAIFGDVLPETTSDERDPG